MGLMDKFKNLFTEEVEEEVEEVKVKEKKEPVKVEKTQVEIAAPTPKRAEKNIELNTPEPEVVKEEPKEEEYKFPFFDDNDFETIETKKEKREREKEKKKSSYRKEAYNPPKEEKHVFKPSPIISPVYGILDKNYQKEDFMSKGDDINRSSSKEDMVDTFRNKAYGGLDDDIDTTLFGKDRILFDDEPEKDIKIEDMEKTREHVLINETPRHREEPDLSDLLGNDKEDDILPKEEKPKPISDEELFSMIDSMYEKGDKKWW